MKKTIKLIMAVVMAAVVVISSQNTMRVYAAAAADRVTKSDNTGLGSDGTMFTSITLGDNLVQGSISTDVISDMYIDGTCLYDDLYSSGVEQHFAGRRDQDYSCGAFISRQNTFFYYADVDFTAYDNDGARAHQHYSLDYYNN